MKKSIWAIGLLLIIPMVGSLLYSGPGPKTMTGTYVWNSNPQEPGDLRVEFSPKDKGQWEVAFHFTFRGNKHVYSGTAKGDLENGALEGTVKNEGKNRTFTFEGTSTSGQFAGTHAETSGGGERKTGTLKLTLKK